jgi:hypothetical protein
MNFKEWLKEHETHKKIPVKKAKKNGLNQPLPTTGSWVCRPPGTRDLKDDLSSDLPPNLKNMGKTYPFKVLGKKKS